MPPWPTHQIAIYKQEKGSIIFNCGSQPSKDNKQQKDYLSAGNETKTSKMLGCFLQFPLVKYENW